MQKKTLIIFGITFAAILNIKTFLNYKEIKKIKTESQKLTQIAHPKLKEETASLASLGEVKKTNQTIQIISKKSFSKTLETIFYFTKKTKISIKEIKICPQKNHIVINLNYEE